MSLRFPFVCLLLAILTNSLTAANFALAAEVVGIVKTVDVDAKTVVVTLSKTDEEVSVMVGPQTVIMSPSKTAIEVAPLRPGTPVIVRERTVAAEIQVADELIGTLESVEFGGQEFALAGQSDQRPISLKTNARTSVVTQTGTGVAAELADLEPGTLVAVVHSDGFATKVSVSRRCCRWGTSSGIMCISRSPR